MKQVTNCKKIETAINRATNKLIKEAEKNGVHENFGTGLYRAIFDKFIDLSDYSGKMNNNRDQLQAFGYWAANYTGK